MGRVKTLTPIKAIRAKCLSCSAGQPREVKLCPITSCPLFEYRSGHRPPTAKEDTTEPEK